MGGFYQPDVSPCMSSLLTYIGHSSPCSRSLMCLMPNRTASSVSAKSNSHQFQLGIKSREWGLGVRRIFFCRLFFFLLQKFLQKLQGCPSEASFLKTYRDVSAKPPKLPNVPVAQMSQSRNVPVGFFENLQPSVMFYSTQLKGEDWVAWFRILAPSGRGRRVHET